MKVYCSTIGKLRSYEFYSCLTIRQFQLLLLAALSTLISCGKVVNKERDPSFNRSVSFLMMENQCAQQISSDFEVSKNIKELYLSTIQNSPQSFFNITPKIYDYENPLILSLEKMEKSYLSLKDDSNFPMRGEELFYLYSENRRYEAQKCSFDVLAQKKKFDFRPFLNFAHNCYKKYGSETCDESEYVGMGLNKEDWVRSNTVELCKSFSKEINCQAEYSISRRKKSLGSLINYYYKRFQSERYDTLFKLIPSHPKHTCQSIKDSTGNKTIMKIKVLDSLSNHGWLVEILNYVEKTWSRGNFQLQLELVKDNVDGAVSIIPTNKGISYVPDDNNRLVYLSTLDDPIITKRVLAHEFGHVLGFPDCYIEFFDNIKKELVYYEISKSNTNIMCSLKADVQVPEDYFSQLTENSCNFN